LASHALHLLENSRIPGGAGWYSARRGEASRNGRRHAALQREGPDRPAGAAEFAMIFRTLRPMSGVR